jgi:hypothetical protein
MWWRNDETQLHSRLDVGIIFLNFLKFVAMGNVDLPQKNEVKCLGMHLNRRLTWAKHIKTKRKQFNVKAKQMNWLIGR